MRVSPIGYWFETLERVLQEAEKSAGVTHNHIEGIKGAQAAAGSIFLARTGASKNEIKQYIEKTFSYDLNRSLDDIRPSYTFDVSCQGSVPEAIIAFIESEDFIDAIRLAISIGGDSDTIACIAGAIAEAFYKRIPKDVLIKAKELLPDELLAVIEQFEEKYPSYTAVD
jgi:ADP-ribosylglycohydrolase